MISFITLSQNTYDVDLPGFCVDSKDCVYVDILLQLITKFQYIENLIMISLNVFILEKYLFQLKKIIMRGQFQLVLRRFDFDGMLKVVEGVIIDEGFRTFVDLEYFRMLGLQRKDPCFWFVFIRLLFSEFFAEFYGIMFVSDLLICFFRSISFCPVTFSLLSLIYAFYHSGKIYKIDEREISSG